MKNLLLFSIIILLTGCASVKTKEGYPKLFSNKASEECEFLGYVESESSSSSPEASLIDSAEKLLESGFKINSNAIKIVNISKVINQISLSAEAYRCASLTGLKVIDETKLNLNIL